MKSVQSCPKLCKPSSLHARAMKRSISVESLPSLYEMYQTLSASKASLQAIPCVVTNAVISPSDEEDRMRQFGACLATPPDVKCQYDDDLLVESVRISRLQKRKQD